MLIFSRVRDYFVHVRKALQRVLRLLEETAAIQVIYIDYELQKLLYEFAADSGFLSLEHLARWMEYPDGPGAPGRLIRHASGHVNHIHIRFRCDVGDESCVEDS